jgi:cobalamin biosynthesis protein CobD/CbiB
MFEKDQLGIFDWILFFVLMAIPVVNIIFFIVLLVGANTNKSLKSYLGALIVMFVVGIFMAITVLAPMIQQIIDMISQGGFM